MSLILVVLKAVYFEIQHIQRKHPQVHTGVLASVDISFLFIEVSRVYLLVSGLWRERWINSRLIRKLARYPHYRYVFMNSTVVCKIFVILYIYIYGAELLTVSPS
jgi:hypothetical protein